MKKAIYSTLCALTMASFAAHAQDPQTLRFGVDPSYPPFESKAPDCRRCRQHRRAVSRSTLAIACT